MSRGRRFRKRFTISMILSAGVFAILSIYSDLPELKKSFLSFSWRYLPLVTVLVFLNYVIRFFKWDHYLKLLNIKLSRSESFSIFMSGMIMTVTPGKFGEVLKSYLLKKVNHTSISKSSPIILAERITDLLAFCLLAGIGSYSLHKGEKVITAGLVVIGLIIFIIGRKPTFIAILNFFKRIPFVAKHSSKLERAYDSAANLLALKNILFPTIISIPSWFSECLAFYFILSGLGCEVTLFKATFIYCISTIIGALSMLPGGLGAMETSMTGMLILAGVKKSSAVAGTILIRCFTLWFAVITGAFFFYLNHKRFGDIDDAIEESSKSEIAEQG